MAAHVYCLTPRKRTVLIGDVCLKIKAFVPPLCLVACMCIAGKVYSRFALIASMPTKRVYFAEKPYGISKEVRIFRVLSRFIQNLQISLVHNFPNLQSLRQD